MDQPSEGGMPEPNGAPADGRFAAAGIDPLGLSRDQIIDFQKSAGLQADGIMGPQTRALWEKWAVGQPIEAPEPEPASPKTSRTRKTATSARRPAASRMIGFMGNIGVFEVAGDGLPDLDLFDAIVVPVDGNGESGQFARAVSDVDPALGERIQTLLGERRDRPRVLAKAEPLPSRDDPLLIAAIGAFGGSESSVQADLQSATMEAIGLAMRRHVKRLLFPLLSVGAHGGSSSVAAMSFFRALNTLAEEKRPTPPMEVHVCTRDRTAMAAIEAMVRAQTNRPASSVQNKKESGVEAVMPAIVPPAPALLSRDGLGYRTDSVAEEPRDFVGVGAEILAFARLAASRQVEPPLAVGVFGDWGSGKSFFMNGVRRKIEALGEGEETRVAKLKEGGEADPKTNIHVNVVQIEFNAWHYIEKNLWASLVEYIFSRLEEWLRAHNEGAADNGGALFEALATSRQLKLDTARAVMSANAELIAARKAAAEAEQAKAEKLKSKTVALNAFFLATVTEVADGEDFGRIRAKLASLGLARANASHEELKAAVIELQQTGDRSKLFWQAARAQAANPFAWFAVASLLLVPIVVPPLANLALEKIGSNAELPVALTGASAALATASAWVKAFLGKVKPALDEAERFSARVHEKMAGLQAEATTQEQKKLVAAQAAAAEAEKQLAAAQERLKLAAAQAADAQNRYTAESARGRLNRFIRERLADGTYGKHLGLIATIRKDFEQLTALVTPSTNNQAELERNKEEEKAYRLRVEALVKEAQEAGEDLLGADARAMLESAQTIQKPPRAFERIVLYIDDLDRCPPDRVVEVLQAVHMLLSFRLFVVFVAVDARWVTCALREVYEHQLHASSKANGADPLPGMAQSAVADMATAEDYMEKIFQIPYWVRPLQGDAAGGFMRKLVDSFGITAPPQEAPVETTDPHDRAGQEMSASMGGEEAVQFAPDAPQPAAAIDRPIEDNLAKEEPDEDAAAAFAKAAKLALVEEDMEALAAMAPVVGDSPRRIKRFFNTYLLIQSIASVSVNENDPDIDAGSRAQVAQMLEGCSFAQQTLALAASLALAMLEEKTGWIDAIALANLDEAQVNARAINGRPLSDATVKLLSAYLKARKPDEAFPNGCHAAFGLFLPIARRYGFHDAAEAMH